MFQYEILPLMRQQFIQTLTDNIAAPFSNHKLQEDGASVALKKSINNRIWHDTIEEFNVDSKAECTA